LIRQLKQKICGKAFGISADLLVQSLGRNSIELGELRMIMLSPAREAYE